VKSLRALTLLILGLSFAAPVFAEELGADELAKRALAKWQEDDERGAVEDLMEALTADPRNLTAYLNYSYILIADGHLAEAKPYVDKYASLNGYDSASTFYLLAKYNLAIGNEAAALENLEKVLLRSPGVADAHFEKGRILARRGEHKKAIEAYDAAVKYGGLSPELMKMRAESLLQTNQLDKAIRDYSSVIAADPQDSQYYAIRAKLLSKKKDYGKAIQDAATAIALNPEDADARFELGLLLMGDKNQQIRAMDSLYLAGTLYARNGQRDRLLQAMEAMSQIDPQSPLVGRLYMLVYPEIVKTVTPVYENVDSAGFTRGKITQNRKGF
jgi:tetratricopeptide (TPR) repeat protein